MIRQIRKMVLFATLLGSFVVISTMAQFIIRTRHRRRRFLARLVSIESKLALRAFQVQVNRSGLSDLDPAAHLIVSNHLGYLDILVLASLLPCAFVTSVEIRNTPFLGWLTELAGCLYVERRSREKLGVEISDIRHELERGLNVCIFPEATSTNGAGVLRFRKPLYNAAIESGRPVLPICLNYLSIEGQPVSIENRDFLFWYGEMAFLSHLWSFFSRTEIVVSVEAGDCVCSTQYQCPQILAEKTHSMVQARFRPISATI